jgi:hypothetical protein
MWWWMRGRLVKQDGKLDRKTSISCQTCLSETESQTLHVALELSPLTTTAIDPGPTQAHRDHALAKTQRKDRVAGWKSQAKNIGFHSAPNFEREAPNSGQSTLAMRSLVRSVGDTANGEQSQEMAVFASKTVIPAIQHKMPVRNLVRARMIAFYDSLSNRRQLLLIRDRLPVDSSVSSKPRQLPLCIASCVSLDQLDHCLVINLPL